ncbi:MAG: hypothetical protein RL207_1856 [Bacteroidota bacterium]|jgi:hypothetical protein
MKWFFAFVFIGLFVDDAATQTVRVKRKYCKSYHGEIPKYSAMLGQEIVEISPMQIDINVKKDSLYITIGSSRISGLYTAQKSTSPNEIIMIFPRENSGIEERIILNTAKKTVLRKGIFPQPDVPLIRVKKSKR